MRYGKWFIGLFTAALLVVAVFFGTYEYTWHGSVDITAVITTPSGTEEVRCWDRDREDIILFLPAYADLTQIKLVSNTTAEVFLEGVPIEEVSLENLPLEVPLKLEYLWRGSTYPYAFTLLQSRNLPTLHLDTVSGTMEAIHEKRGNAESGGMRLYTEFGALDYTGQVDSVKGRGNSTWDEEKKPYNLTLKEDADLLGMGAAKRWILLANAKDHTHIRNKLVLDFAQEAGLAYTPECQWVELYTNGDYGGLYLLCERNEVHEERVNISREDSFLVGKDWPWRFQQNGDPYFELESQAALRIYYGGMSQEKIHALWQQAENAILAEDDVDPDTGKHWQELLDLDSWVKKVMIEEVFANPDGPALSQFFYYDGGAEGKIFAGPVWDYDLIAGGEVETLYTARTDTAHGSPWYGALSAKDTFRQRRAQLYEGEFLPLLQTYFQSRIPGYLARIRQAAAMDQLRWRTGNMDWEGERLLDFLTRRTEFLKELWLGETLRPENREIPGG